MHSDNPPFLYLSHMNDKTKKIVYYIGTALLTLIMCFSVFMYLTNTEGIRGEFSKFNYPTYLVYPLAAAKILGLIAIWSNMSRSLKEWAYAGFFFNILLAYVAHWMTDGGIWFAFIAMLGLVLSYVGWEKEDRFHTKSQQA